MCDLCMCICVCACVHVQFVHVQWCMCVCVVLWTGDSQLAKQEGGSRHQPTAPEDAVLLLKGREGAGDRVSIGLEGLCIYCAHAFCACTCVGRGQLQQLLQINRWF